LKCWKYGCSPSIVVRVPTFLNSDPC
jgi:hypothetical protein